MDIVLDQKTPTEASIKITLKQADYQPKVEEKIKEYARKANLKGFRPGKVPKAIIQRMYGKSILVDEINHILSHSLNDYILEKKIQILGEPLPNKDQIKSIDWDNQMDFLFEYEIGMAQDFQVNLTKKKKVTSYHIKVDKKMIDETTANLQKQHGGHIHPETSELTDILSGLLEQPSTDLKNNTAIEIEQLDTKVQKSFIGKKIADVIQFDVRKVFKDDDLISVHTGKKPEEAKDVGGKFQFKVETISRPELAELNQEFFDKIFGPGSVKDEAEFRQKIEDSIASNYRRETDTLLVRHIQESMIKDVKVVMPDRFLKKWLLATNDGKITEEDIEKEYQAYSRELRWSLIKNKIASEHGIKVEHEEIIETTKGMIRSQFGPAGNSPQIEDSLDSFVDNYLKGEEGNNYTKVHNQVHADKIFNLIKEKITISDKNVDVEQFKKIALN